MQQEQYQQAMNMLLRRVRDGIDEYLRAIDASDGATDGTPDGALGSEVNSAAFEEARRVLIAATIEKTGYPEELLDLDLDLEADLGIDSIKQVAIYAAARATWDLAPDPDVRLGDHTTLRKAISYMAQRMPADLRSAPSA